MMAVADYCQRCSYFLFEYHNDIGDVGAVMNNVLSKPTRNTMKLGELALKISVFLQYKIFSLQNFFALEHLNIKNEQHSQYINSYLSINFNIIIKS